MSRAINFESRLKVIARHGRILLWIINEEEKGNLSKRRVLDYIQSTDVIDSDRVLSNLIETGSISIIDDKIRINLSVKNFIQWANDSSEILPASRIESMLIDVMNDVKRLTISKRRVLSERKNLHIQNNVNSG